MKKLASLLTSDELVPTYEYHIVETVHRRRLKFGEDMFLLL